MSVTSIFIPTRADLRWREQAACRDEDPNTFTPEIDANASGIRKAAHLQSVVAALRICGRCPVSDECLADAYANGDKWTIRGGTTGDQRVQARKVDAMRELRRAKHEVPGV